MTALIIAWAAPEALAIILLLLLKMRSCSLEDR